MPNDSELPPQILSQGEVENLLAQVAQEDETVLVHATATAPTRKTKSVVQPYDFRHPVFLSAAEMRKLRLRHERFLSSLAARLSVFFRLEFTLQMAKLQTMPFQKFTETFANPTHLTFFKVDPLPGICLLEIHPRVGLTMVDRLMGGAAHSVNAHHDFTEIELALLDQVVHIILAEWCARWADLRELRPQVIGHENSGGFAQTSTRDAIFLALTLEARFGDCLEPIQIGFPYPTLDPLIRALKQDLDSGTAERDPELPRPAWNPVLGDMPLPLTASWDGIELNAGDLAQLRVGDLVQLSPAAPSQVRVHISGLPKFSARLGRQNQHWAVQITGSLAL